MEDKVAVLVMGSVKDLPVAKRIVAFWEEHGFDVPYEMRVCSGHKMARELVELVSHYTQSYKQAVFVGIAGRANALAPVMAAHTTMPVLACPVLSEAFATVDVFSSLRLPSDVPCATILEPENVALFILHVFALSDAGLKEKLHAYYASRKRHAVSADAEVHKKHSSAARKQKHSSEKSK
jgi:phosphoribosylaminoimidazole carboxylase PurE protein